MLIKKLIITLLFSYSVIATSSFIGDTERAELFEMTDNEIPTIRITLPEQEYKELIDIAGKGYRVYFPDGSEYFLSDSTGGESIDWSPMASAPPGYNPFQQLSFETKNAAMTFEINGTTEKYNKITFKLGGSSSRMFGKQGYNIKIRGKQDLHGRTQIKLRPDTREATYLRTKLASDIHQRLGVPTISANYATLYINDEYMGLYVLMDSIKKSWIEYVYGDIDTTGLYECGSTGNTLSVDTSSYRCTNENEDVEDNSELIEFLTALDNANSAEDIEDIFDIDLFLTEIAYEYLAGSWDHFLIFGHNFYLYKQPNGKWLYFISDFDGDIGQDISMGLKGVRGQSSRPPFKPEEATFENYTFDEWAHFSTHIIDILIKNDSTRFDNILKNIVNEVFNPSTLFPHIDELKEFIRPYVVIDKTPNENGKYPGKVHVEAEDYSLEEWEANCEFTTIRSIQKSLGYGLKYWILSRYRTVCSNYDIECDSDYIDDNYEYSVDENVEGTLEDDEMLDWGSQPTQPTQPIQTTPTSNNETPKPTITEEPAEPTQSAVEPPKPTQTISPFIGDTERAELFEMTDNEIPIIKITIPENEYETLKEIANRGYCVYLPNGVVYPLNHIDDGPKIDWTPIFSAPPGYNAFEQAPFETKNAVMTFEINGTIEEYNKITFKLGGSSSRMFGKQGYNIKIRGKKDLHGRTQIKLRSDAREATYLRTKLASDIHHRLGLQTILANYATLYINDEYMGLYILMDSIKKSWIEYVYGDADTTGLYQCDKAGTDLSLSTSYGCINENEDVEDDSELVEFLTALDNANSAEDIEDIFDVDSFLTEIAYEYLVGSWDHFLVYGHNFYLYKQQNGKWLYFITDFDGDIGQDISMGMSGVSKDKNLYKPDEADFENFTFEEWTTTQIHLIDILIKNNSTRFDDILKNLVTDVFNPATLYPHIDELKEFIRPYVIEDKTLNEDGKYPGKLHEEAGDYSLEEWEANCEFTTVSSIQKSLGYGLKYWILSRYRAVCENYNMQCDPIYIDDNYEYPIDESVQATVDDDLRLDHSEDSPKPIETDDKPSQPTQTSNVEPPQPTVTEEPAEPTEVIPPDEPPELTTTTTTTSTPTPTVHYKCMAESIGYPCCSKLNKIVVRHDKYGDWGYDILRRMHCGISPYVPPAPPAPSKPKCWTEKYGHPCCDDCKAFRVGLLGLWGYDFKNKKWCGLSYSCH